MCKIYLSILPVPTVYLLEYLIAHDGHECEGGKPAKLSQMSRKKDRQTNRKTNKQKDKQTERQTVKQKKIS